MGNTVAIGSGSAESTVLATKDSSASGSSMTGSLIDKEASVGSSEVATAKKKNICCACPEAKLLRDDCVVEHGQEACTKWIDAHLQCLRKEGFKV